MKTEKEIVKFLHSFLQSKNIPIPHTAMVLGSGWNRVVEELEITEKLSFKEVFGVSAAVPGHKGELCIFQQGLTLLAGSVLAMAGRYHAYEGYTPYEATLPVRVFAKLGVKNLILTSAAGGLNPSYKVGDLIVLKDIISLFLHSPLTGPQFQDLSEPFDPGLRKKALAFYQKEKIPYNEGVYMYLRGPHYESFADKKACRILGADVVGMSTVPETIMAAKLGMRVLGLSCVTNLAFVKHSHAEVVENANKVSSNMVKLLKQLVKDA